MFIKNNKTMFKLEGKFYVKPESEILKTKYEGLVETSNKEDAGVDVFCKEDQVIPPNSFSNKVKLGISGMMTCPLYKNVSYQLVVRSSTGSKTQLRQCNAPAIIDSGYRGEIMGLLDNFSDEPYHIKEGDRLFQIIHPLCIRPDIILCDELPTSKRGKGGFGSTGKGGKLKNKE